MTNPIALIRAWLDRRDRARRRRARERMLLAAGRTLAPAAQLRTTVNQGGRNGQEAQDPSRRPTAIAR